MTIWLLIAPALAWIFAGTWGLSLIKRPAPAIWRGYFATRTTPPPYEATRGQRWLVGWSRVMGWMLLASASFLTIMALLVAVGVIPSLKA